MTQHTVAFDTLQYAKRLVAAGFTQQQAEIQAEVLVEIVDERLATKQDLENLKNELIIKLGGITVGCTGLLVLLMKLFRL